MFVATAVVSLLLAALLVPGLHPPGGRGWIDVRSPVGADRAAAAALVCYFALVITAHSHAGDAKSLPTPVLMLALAIAALMLRLAMP